MVEIVTLTVEADESKQRIDKFLVNRLPHLTRTRIQSLIDQGNVSCCEKTIMTSSYKTRLNDVYTLTIPPAEEATPIAQDIPLEILFEDTDLLVLNKPVGMVVHPAPGHHQSTLVNALLAHCQDSLSGIGGVKRPGIVHRLDKETSGLMVVAKHDEAHHHLCKQFSNRTLSRSYKAFVWGIPHPSQGIIEGNIGRHPQNRQKMAIVKKGGKPATTHYLVLKRFGDNVALVQCDLKTGRTHQIRVHLASIGHPLVGDPVYGRIPKGAKKTVDPFIIDFPRQALHAYKLTFIHPRTNESMTFESQLPTDLEELQSFL